MTHNVLEPTPLPPSIRANRVPIGSPLYNEIVEFFYDEAEMLDQLRLHEWRETLAQDLEYGVPLRLTRPTREKEQTVVRNMQHMHDNYGSIAVRVMRIMDTKSAWGEDPPSRTRRLVTNVRVYKTEKENEFKVQSYLLLTRNRFDHDYFDLLPCERHDLIRREEDGKLKLASREIILDQAVIGTPNLGIFF